MAKGDYWDRFNGDLLDLLPPDLGTVLEVGCGSGRLCEEYRRRNPGVSWIGVETNTAAALAAIDRKINVITADIEEPREIGQALDGLGCDALVLGDVLEHLRDPWAALERCVVAIKPGGLLLASIPNVGHMSVVLSLLRGEWEYQDEGIFDATHLRWFTLKSIRKLFADAGLEVFEVRGRQCGFDPAAFAELRRLVKVDEADPFWMQAKTLQYLVRARKPIGHVEVGKSDPEGRPLPGVTRPLFGGFEASGFRLHLHAVADTLDVHRQRIAEPHRAIQTIPGVTISDDVLVQPPWGAMFPDRHPKLPADRDAVLVLQRWRRGSMAEIARRVLEHNPKCLVVAEVDDHPGHLPGMERDDFAALRLVHAVQCSTEPLAEWCRRYNPEVRVFPNMIAELPPFEPRPEKPPGEAVLFYGAQGRETSWRPIMPALNRVLAEFPAVRAEVVHDRAFFEALAVDAKRKRFRPFLPYQEYRAAIRSCDIALLPLEPSDFNAMKSDVKWLECAAEGTAVLMSPFASDQARSMDTLVFQPGPMLEYWSDMQPFDVRLGNLIRNPDRRRYLACNAYAFVRDHRLLGGHYRGHVDWYRSLLARKAELDAAILARCGEMAQAASASS